MIRGGFALVVRLQMLFATEWAGLASLIRFEILLIGAIRRLLISFFKSLLSSKVVQVCLVNIVSDYMIGLIFFLRKAKYLNVLIVSYHDSPFVEFESLTVSLNTPLTEADMLMSHFSPSLE